MNAEAKKKLSVPVVVLTAVALVLLLVLIRNPFTSTTPTSAPIWWVSLTAPQYPKSAFPDGIRINFHVDGVFNGCHLIKSKEKSESQALDCKAEMDAINHYVGMYPISAGAPIERAVSPFVFALLALMLVAFALPGKKVRVGLLAAGCLAIGIWMFMGMYGQGGVNLLSPNYIADMQKTMDLDPHEYKDWSGYHAIQESYTDALGLYFRDIPEIKRRAAIMGNATNIVVYGLAAAMLLLVVGNWFTRFFYWLLVLVPMALPVFFIIDYSGWLWWFGHNLNKMGAFTVKPFMPTVFGQGKVAQFATHSYPYWGFGVMVAMSVVLAVLALIRRKELKEGVAE
jgi:hypothetical protein